MPANGVRLTSAAHPWHDEHCSNPNPSSPRLTPAMTTWEQAAVVNRTAPAQTQWCLVSFSFTIGATTVPARGPTRPSESVCLRLSRRRRFSRAHEPVRRTVDDTKSDAPSTTRRGGSHRAGQRADIRPDRATLIGRPWRGHDRKSRGDLEIMTSRGRVISRGAPAARQPAHSCAGGLALPAQEAGALRRESRDLLRPCVRRAR
jgi:hypothetical protein